MSDIIIRQPTRDEWRRFALESLTHMSRNAVLFVMAQDRIGR